MTPNAPDPIAIDVGEVLQRSVTSLYSSLVTRPTGRAVRMAIETQLFKQRGSMIRGVDKTLALPDTSSAFEERMFELLCSLIGNLLGHYKTALRRIGGSSPVVSWPVMPLNTDGIDAGGSNIRVENLTIRNYDDAVVPKPANQGYKFSEDGCA